MIPLVSPGSSLFLLFSLFLSLHDQLSISYDPCLRKYPPLQWTSTIQWQMIALTIRKHSTISMPKSTRTQRILCPTTQPWVRIHPWDTRMQHEVSLVLLGLCLQLTSFFFGSLDPMVPDMPYHNLAMSLPQAHYPQGPFAGPHGAMPSTTPPPPSPEMYDSLSPPLSGSDTSADGIYHHSNLSGTNSPSSSRAHSLVHRTPRYNPSPSPTSSSGRRRSRSHDSDDDDDNMGSAALMENLAHSRKEATRRQRIEAEQRRRDELRDGYAKLKDALPVSNQKSSKVSLLERGRTSSFHSYWVTNLFSLIQRSIISSHWRRRTKSFKLVSHSSSRNLKDCDPLTRRFLFTPTERHPQTPRSRDSRPQMPPQYILSPPFEVKDHHPNTLVHRGQNTATDLLVVFFFLHSHDLWTLPHHRSKSLSLISPIHVFLFLSFPLNFLGILDSVKWLFMLPTLQSSQNADLKQ